MDEMMRKGEIFRNFKYGLFVHYVPSITSDEHGAYIDNADCGTVNLCAEQRRTIQSIFLTERLFGGIHKIKVVKQTGVALEINATKINRL